MAEYIRLISRDKLIEHCVKHRCSSVPIDFIKAQKPIIAADVQPTENMATVSDEFICKKCGIYLKDYSKAVIDEDDGDEYHYEYEPKFCPECGAKVKDGDEECQ